MTGDSKRLGHRSTQPLGAVATRWAAQTLVTILSALSKLRRLRRAQISPKHLLGALWSVEVRSGLQAAPAAAACVPGGGGFQQTSKSATRGARRRLFCARLVRLEQAQASATGTKKPQASAWGFEVC